MADSLTKFDPTFQVISPSRAEVAISTELTTIAAGNQAKKLTAANLDPDQPNPKATK